MGLADALKNPALWGYVGDVGAAMNARAAGQPFDLRQANQGLLGALMKREQEKKMRGLLDGAGLNPYQRSLVEAMPPEAAYGVLAQHAFPQGSDDFGLNITWGTDDSGNYVPMQPRKSGGLFAAEMPEGVRPIAPYNYTPVDTGTGTVFVDPRRPGVPVAPNATAVDGAPPAAPAVIPKDIGGKKRQEVEAQNLADAREKLKMVSGTADEILLDITGLRDDPYLSRMTGPIDSRLPNLSADAARVQSRMDKLKGQGFLVAYQKLKGGGTITEREGAAAEAAQARLNAAQSDADYVAALNDMEAMVRREVGRARQAAGYSVSPSDVEIPEDALDSAEIPEDLLNDLRNTPPGTLVTSPDGDKYIWDGERLLPR